MFGGPQAKFVTPIRLNCGQDKTDPEVRVDSVGTIKKPSGEPWSTNWRRLIEVRRTQLSFGTRLTWIAFQAEETHTVTTSSPPATTGSLIRPTTNGELNRPCCFGHPNFFRISKFWGEAGAGIEPANRGFADPDLTTWLPRRNRERETRSTASRCQSDGPQVGGNRVIDHDVTV